MSGTISGERVVKVPASEAWKLYGTLRLASYVQEALPGLITKIDVIEGDGTPGTIIEIFFAPGMEGGLNSYKKKFTVVDGEKRVKVAEVVEGGYLDLGFNLYRVTFEVIEEEEKEKEQCITRATIEYEVKEEAAANAAIVSIQPLATIMQVAADYLEKTYNLSIAGPLGSYKEIYTVVDNEKRVKVVEVVEGGYLDLGFTLYRVTVEVLEKEDKENECITRITVEYELKEEAAANVSFVSVKHIVAVMQVVIPVDYLHDIAGNIGGEKLDSKELDDHN